MKCVIVTTIAIAFGFQSSLTSAGTYSSTSTLNQKFSTNISFTSGYFDPKSGNSRFKNYIGRLSSGVNSASVAVDTDSDTGFISGLDFKPFDMTSLMNTRRFELPANDS
jgi:hypothetical protein